MSEGSPEAQASTSEVSASLQQYQDFVSGRMGQRFKDNLKEGLSCFALGLAGEAGEVADIIKKVFYHDHPLTPELRAKILKELGDQMWYNVGIAVLLGFKATDIVDANMAKLAVRYPNGFTEADSIARRDVK